MKKASYYQYFFIAFLFILCFAPGGSAQAAPTPISPIYNVSCSGYSATTTLTFIDQVLIPRSDIIFSGVNDVVGFTTPPSNYFSTGNYVYNAVPDTTGYLYAIPPRCTDNSSFYASLPNPTSTYYASDNTFTSGGLWYQRYSTTFAPIPAITFDYPATSSTIPDFQYWKINYTAVNPGTLVINYSPAPGYAGTTGTDTASFSPYVNPNPALVYKNNSLFYPPLAPPVAYNATATLYDASGTIQAQAGASFLISGYSSVSSTPYAPASTSYCGDAPPAFFGTTSTAPYFFIENPIPDITWGICSAFTGLFITNSSQNDDLGASFNAVWGSVSKKPPIGYFTLISDDITGLSTSTASSTLINASTTATLALVLSPIQTGITWILWLLFAFWLFHRMRKLEL